MVSQEAKRWTFLHEINCLQRDEQQKKIEIRQVLMHLIITEKRTIKGMNADVEVRKDVIR